MTTKNRTVSPKISDLNSLRQPLTVGERLVFEYFHEHLPLEWEIYLQPHLNGLKPDFVLLHPQNGVAVFEVKDWNLDAMNYFVDSSGGKPKLMAKDDHKTFSLDSQNPVRKVGMYKDEIFNLYCPRLAERTGLGAITAGVIFPFAPQEQVEKLLHPFRTDAMKKYQHLHPIVGSDTLESGHIWNVFPNYNRNDKMSEDLANDLRAWLTEPSFVKDQRTRTELSPRQRELATTRTESGYRRIKGAAGSGKSVVLAARATELASAEQKVLVCTFNITLMNYLRDLVAKWGGSDARNAITWVNFHHLCKRICHDAGFGEEYSRLWRDNDEIDQSQNERLAKLMLKTLDSTDEFAIYDAILVDEGQDFRLDWWHILRRLIKANGEMVLVADKTQDVYGTAGVWTDEAMSNSGFRGQWVNLEVSYRMPPKLVEIAKQFAEKFLPDALRDIPVSQQGDLVDMYPCEINWKQTTRENLVLDTVNCITNAMASLTPEDKLAIADIVVIVDSIEIGIEIGAALAEKSIKCINTFSTEKNGDDRRKKIAFYTGSPNVKLTTIHSFKGFESRLLVLAIHKANDDKSLAVAYTGLTRLKRSEFGGCSKLFVICSEKELEKFANTLKI